MKGIKGSSTGLIPVGKRAEAGAGSTAGQAPAHNRTGR